MNAPGGIVVPKECVSLLLHQRARYRCGLFKVIKKVPYGKTVYLRYVSRFEILRRRKIQRLYSIDMESTLSTFKYLLPEAPSRVLDVGAGMAGMDAALHSYYGEPGPEFWLLDRQGVSRHHAGGFNVSADKFAHYNSFEQATALLVANGVQQERIRSVEITAEGFPDYARFDIIVSFLAWGFHFPVETYLQPACEVLRPGGCMVLDVRKDTGGMERLQKEFGDDCTVVYDAPKFQRALVRKK